MTLPNEAVIEMLAEQFVIGARNIEREQHVGLSHGYACNQTAVGTTNGAGGRNVQILVLAADETVVHALPGFWHAQDLLPELQLALELHRLHRDEDLSRERKLAMFDALHRSHLRRHGEDAARRGDWQGFDRAYELERAEREVRDTVVLQADGPRRLKSIPELVHDRLLARPFEKLADFGLATFVDYGRPFYDNNAGLDDGRNFPRAAQVNAKREREREKAERAAEKAERAARADKARAAKKAGKPAQPVAGAVATVAAENAAAPRWQPAP